MNTPICDFVRKYDAENSLRLHMPGHKGNGILGCEGLDITEIDGADSLYEAEGIIRESELNAGGLFGAHTFYSTEGSSLSIRAMLYLCVIYANSKGEKPLILAGRNAHKTFLSAAALLDFDVEWLYPTESESYISCTVTAEGLQKRFDEIGRKPTAFYVTSPDYLGNILDISALAQVCHKNGSLLLVDNAHGAYLRFLPLSKHPIDLGADMCCDSAHKTLSVITGGAYLHISHNAPGMLSERAKEALALFGSTSPSYLILQSLDTANLHLASDYRQELAEFIKKVDLLKDNLIKSGYCIVSDEPLKITVNASLYGYTGREISDILSADGIVCEFCDSDFIVFMLTPENKDDELRKLEMALSAIPKKIPKEAIHPSITPMKKVMSVRTAYLSAFEVIPVEQAQGRVLATPCVSCPPAVPIAVPGEELSEQAVDAFAYYGTNKVSVVK